MITDEESFFNEEIGIDWDQDTGKPSVELVGSAIQFWSIQQYPERTTVRAAALAFKMKDADVVRAVEEHPWMYFEGPSDDYTKLIIEHEGE